MNYYMYSWYYESIGKFVGYFVGYVFLLAGWFSGLVFSVVLPVVFLKLHFKSKKSIVAIYKDIYEKIGEIIRD